MATPWELLISGKVLDAVVNTYTGVMGEMFYALIIMFGLTLVYIKTKNIGVVGVIALLVGGSVVTLLPAVAQRFFYLLLVFGIAVTIYKVFKG